MRSNNATYGLVGAGSLAVSGSRSLADAGMTFSVFNEATAAVTAWAFFSATTLALASPRCGVATDSIVSA